MAAGAARCTGLFTLGEHDVQRGGIVHIKAQRVVFQWTQVFIRQAVLLLLQTQQSLNGGLQRPSGLFEKLIRILRNCAASADTPIPRSSGVTAVVLRHGRKFIAVLMTGIAGRQIHKRRVDPVCTCQIGGGGNGPGNCVGRSDHLPPSGFPSGVPGADRWKNRAQPWGQADAGTAFPDTPVVPRWSTGCPPDCRGSLQSFPGSPSARHR